CWCVRTSKRWSVVRGTAASGGPRIVRRGRRGARSPSATRSPTGTLSARHRGRGEPQVGTDRVDRQAEAGALLALLGLVLLGELLALHDDAVALLDGLHDVL